MIALESVFDIEKCTASVIWDKFAALLRRLDLIEDTYEVMLPAYAQVPIDDVRKFVEQGTSFEVRTAQRRISLRAGSYFIRVAQCQMATEQFPFPDTWVIDLASELGFVNARLYDPEYDRWQNETDPDVFKSAGRKVNKKQLVPDPPFTQLRIDISQNPGRREGRKGYSESLGHVMWLSPEFLLRTKCDLERLRNAGINVVPINDLSKIELSESPFSDDNPPSEDIRSLVFPKQ